MARVVWNNSMDGPPVVDNARSVPKRPVIWWGEIWLLMPDGVRDTRQWRAKRPMLKEQAQDVLRAMLADLIAENGNNAAIDSGFMMMSR